MGFTVYYQSTEPVSADAMDQINLDASELCSGRTWLSCEPVYFFSSASAGLLIGGVKPNFSPHPDEKAAAEAEGLPDGTLHDAIEVLCELSLRHNIEWSFSHDHDQGPIGFIRNGVADQKLLQQMSEFSNVGNILDELGINDPPPTPEPSPESDDEEDDDDGPRILRFGPIDS